MNRILKLIGKFIGALVGLIVLAVVAVMGAIIWSTLSPTARSVTGKDWLALIWSIPARRELLSRQT